MTPYMIRSADSALVKTPIGHVRRRISGNPRSRMLVVRIVFQGARGNEKRWKQWNRSFSRQRTAASASSSYLARHTLNRRSDSVREGAPKISFASPT